MFSLSPTGVAIYRLGETNNTYKLGWLEKGGTLTPVAGEPPNVAQISVSADEKKVALVVGENNRRAIWVQEFERGTQTRLSPELQGWNVDPVWSPDGKSIVYERSDKKEGFEQSLGLVVIRADGAPAPRPLVEHPRGIFPMAFSFDGKRC